MMNFGNLTMWLALIAICISSASYLMLNVKKDSAVARGAAHLSLFCFAILVTIASISLMYFILDHRFVYSYIARYSCRDLPLEYLISSFWAGQEGSFLLWVLLSSWLGLILMSRARDMEPQVMLVYNLNNIFLVILLIKQSPFKMLSFTPVDGNGLNMLLQDPWMVIHPPVVFLGYAAFAIPFAFAVAALWRREYDRWVNAALPWTVFSFLTLGAGIFIGAYWSYKVLGWGGYWGWDPVENASLLPWLAGTALLHGMILQKVRGRLRKTNFVLAAFSFLLVIYCTFLTRSGVLADFSVHSFVELGITGWLVIFMFVFMAISIGLLVVRAKEIRSVKEAANIVSRESGFLAAIVLLSTSIVLIGLGTSAPLITRLFGNPSKVSTKFYVDTNLPVAIIVLLLLSLIPLLTWGANKVSKLAPRLIWPVTGGVVSGVVTLWNGFPGTGAFLLSLFAGAAVATNLFLSVKLIRKKTIASSAAIIHLGVGLVFVGIVSSSAYDRTQKVLLPQNILKNVMGHEMRFNGASISTNTKGMWLHLPVSVKSGSHQFMARPDIYSERMRGGQIQRYAHPHIKRGLIRDLYLSPVEYEPGQKKAHSGSRFYLEKGKKIRFHDYELTFTGFDISGMMHRESSGSVSVGADILVSYKGGNPVKVKPVIRIGGTREETNKVKLPGPQQAYITLVKVDATAKAIGLAYEGPACAAKKDAERSCPALIAEISVKPGMSTLWLGALLILAGSTIGIARHWPK